MTAIRPRGTRRGSLSIPRGENGDGRTIRALGDEQTTRTNQARLRISRDNYA
jgi:hypothetical protein